MAHHHYQSSTIFSDTFVLVNQTLLAKTHPILITIEFDKFLCLFVFQL